MPKPTDYRIQGLADLNPRAILCCQQRQIGDVLLLTPGIHMLKKRFPQARIDVYTEKKCAPVLQNNPEIGHIWTIDRKLGFFDALAFYRRVGKGPDDKGYDLIIDFQQLPRIRWMLLFAKCPVKLSFPPPWYNMPFYTHWAPVSGPYAAKCKAGVLMHALGLPWENDPPRLCLSQAERQTAEALRAQWGIGPGDALVTVDPTSRRLSRQWPGGHYASLLRMVSQQRPGVKFLLFYGPGEEEQVVRDLHAQAVAQGLDPDRAIVPPRMVSLREMAALMATARLHLGNTSAPQHMALAVGTRTLTILGSSGNAWVYPGPGHEAVQLGLPCQPCSEAPCPDGLRCLTDLAPQTVLPRILSLLDSPALGETQPTAGEEQ